MKHIKTYDKFLGEKKEWRAQGPFIAVGYGKHSGGEDEVIDFSDGFGNKKLARTWIQKAGNRGLSWSVMTAAEYNHTELGIDESINEDLTFVYDGVQINNPFMNDDGIGTEVDPTSYYGKHYTKAPISKVVNAMENLVTYYEDWKLSENGTFDGDVGAKLEEAYKAYKKAK